MMRRAALTGAVQGTLIGLGLATVTFGAMWAIDVLRGPHIEWVCTSSHTVTETVLMPTVDAQGYSTLMPMIQDRSVCDVGYPICVNRGTEVNFHSCK